MTGDPGPVAELGEAPRSRLTRNTAYPKAMSVSLGMPTVLRSAPALPPRERSASGLLDRFGRTATDLRISLTDRCNLRCTYCMPAEGLPTQPASSLLQAEEIARLAKIAVESLGVRQVRFTGGEPLLRKDLLDIIRSVAALEPRPEISLTTNAIGLSARATDLRAAGLDRINVSLDTVHAATFLEVTRRPFLQRVLDGIDAAAASGLTPVKINAVLLRGVNDDEAPELLAWALERGHHQASGGNDEFRLVGGRPHRSFGAVTRRKCAGNEFGEFCEVSHAHWRGSDAVVAVPVGEHHDLA